MPQLPGGWELILILLVVVLVFGSKRLPDSARALGRSMRILKAETKGLREDDAPARTTTAAVVPPAPVAGPQPTVEPVVPPAQPYVGQQLFDANGQPVVLPVSGGSQAVPPVEQPARPQG